MFANKSLMITLYDIFKNVSSGSIKDCFNGQSSMKIVKKCMFEWANVQHSKSLLEKHQCVLFPHSSSNLCHFFQLVGRSYSVNIPFTSRLFVHNPTQWYELSQSNNKNIRYEKLIFGVCDSSSQQKSLNPERLTNKCKEKHKTLLVCHPVYKISFIINNQ